MQENPALERKTEHGDMLLYENSYMNRHEEKILNRFENSWKGFLLFENYGNGRVVRTGNGAG